MTDIDRPLVTFALFAYNQAPFIAEAVAAALAQTYSPLEIIISDDCSTDGTFGLIEQGVSGYQGPHRVVLNRNASNLGIGSHVSKIIEKSTGELILLAAGDDVSEANRTQEVVNYWLSRNKTIDAIWSDVRLIDDHGTTVGTLRRPVSNEPIETQIRRMVPSLVGCSHATTKRLFQQYGPLREDITYEDRAFAFRALCAGGVGRIEKLLVRYRVHTNNISDDIRVSRNKLDAGLRLKNHRLHLQRKLAVFLGYQEDVACIAAESRDASVLRHIDEVINSSLEDNFIERQIHSDSISHRWSGFRRGFFRLGPPLTCRARYLLTLIDPRVWFYLSNTLFIRWARKTAQRLRGKHRI